MPIRHRKEKRSRLLRNAHPGQRDRLQAVLNELRKRRRRMNRTARYAAKFVESFPTPMEPGILYISAKYSTAGHLCPCGCGREVVTTLSPVRWRITFDGEVSLWTSVAATGLPCNSHYFITRGEVDGHHHVTVAEVAGAREVDRRSVEKHRATDDGLAKRLWRRLRARR